MKSIRILALAAGALVMTAAAVAQTPLTTIRVAQGLVRPLYVTHAPGDPNRIYIVEQRGSGGVATRGDIRVLNIPGNTLEANPFLSVTGLATGSEQGLLGLAFHPNFASNGYFYVYLTQTGGAVVIRRYTALSPTQADAGSAQTVLIQSQPFANHNGGWIGFGPDGYLYAAVGDGGSANDPQNNAQNVNNLLGKMLRIDVNSDAFPADPNKNYAIPPDNPFASGGGAPEIWAYGLRNPWRASFDRGTDALYIGDVGQDAREEVSYQPANAFGSMPGDPGYQGGRNYGWRCREGNICTPGVTCVGQACTSPAFIDPIHWYTNTGAFIAITGGYVYRGCAIPSLHGHYFFADVGASVIWTFNYAGANGPQNAINRTAELAPGGGLTINNIVSFGEDAKGEIYICKGTATNGEVYKIIPRCAGDITGNGSVGQEDLGIILSNFGQVGLGDLDCNGVVDQGDLGILLGAFGCQN